MGVKQGLKRISGGANLLHPKLSLWWILGAIVAVAVGFFVFEYGKKAYDKTKGLVGQATPGTSGKGELRSRLGI